MFANCSNPACRAPFDYRKGRLVRFCIPPLDARSSASQHRVEHFWLCGCCSDLYVFEFDYGTGIRIKPRVGELRKTPVPSFVAAA